MYWIQQYGWLNPKHYCHYLPIRNPTLISFIDSIKQPSILNCFYVGNRDLKATTPLQHICFWLIILSLPCNKWSHRFMMPREGCLNITLDTIDFHIMKLKIYWLHSWRNSSAGCLCFRVFLIANMLWQAREMRLNLKRYHPKAWCSTWLGQTAKRLLTRL